MYLTEIIANILINYAHLLTQEEVFALNNNPQELNVRQVVNKIWSNYVTNPFEYEEGKEFCYLVDKNALFAEIAFEFDEFLDYKRTHFCLEVLNNEKLIDEMTGRTGFIASIDWTKTNKVLLPNTVSKIGDIISGGIDFQALFTVSIGEGIISAEYDSISDMANRNNTLFLDLNKRKYQRDYKLNTTDEAHLVTGMISYYLLQINQLTNTIKQEELSKKYRKYILKRYRELTEQNNYQDTEFIKEVINYINKSENIVKRSL